MARVRMRIAAVVAAVLAGACGTRGRPAADDTTAPTPGNDATDLDEREVSGGGAEDAQDADAVPEDALAPVDTGAVDAGDVADGAVDAGSEPDVPMCEACTWTHVPPMHIARASAGAAWGDGQLYVWAGVNDYYGAPNPKATPPYSNVFEATAERYDPATDSWTKLPTPPVYPGVGEGGVVWGADRLYVYGNSQGFTGPSSGTATPAAGAMWLPQQGAWKALPTKNSPGQREYPAVVWTGDRLMVWGGGHLTDGISGLYDPKTDTWDSLSFPSQFAAADHAYVGCRTWDGENYFGLTDKLGVQYNIASKTWMSFPPYPPSVVNDNGVAMPWGGAQCAPRPGGGYFLAASNAKPKPAGLWVHLPGTNSYQEILMPHGSLIDSLSVTDGMPVLFAFRSYASAGAAVYNPTVETWQIISNPTPLFPRSLPAISVLGDNSWVIGGLCADIAAGVPFMCADGWRLHVP